MSAVVAVLVVPHASDSAGLLADGLCGSRPPLVHRPLTAPPAGYEFLSRWSTRGSRSADTETGLVLWWDGRCVLEGLDRLCRARGHFPWKNGTSLPSLLSYAQYSAQEGVVARVVCLDSEGREVSP